jgi:hypothetical protein
MLESGETLTLRYRLIVHPGRWDPDRLQSAIVDFQSAALHP